ncbi:UNKNOWN [Stylonychia lemnae]|uniref:Uncharacterized protein n=1 Tax=Stylonychia lemnae TaxID=5949 RepID=A0A078B9H1_STYLE|nr:UNKNOWN [Stylonychia lemnae]|eukprot:CDW91064.1 UNKNOWN [Stylonychia lemnae]
MLQGDDINNYIQKISLIEAENLNQMIQSVVQKKSIIERYSQFATEQLGIEQDISKLKASIKSTLKLGMVLTPQDMAGNQNIGNLLNSYFKGHNKISFDLFINAIIIHYDIDLVSQPVIAYFFQMIFEISEHNTNIYVNDIILLIQTEYSYRLLINRHTIVSKLVLLQIFGLDSIKVKKSKLLKDISLKCKLREAFKDSQMKFHLQLVDKMFGIYEQSINNDLSKELKKLIVNDESVQNMSAVEDKKLNHKDLSRDMNLYQICAIIQRFQFFQKQQFQELLSLESREKEFHASIVVLLDSLTQERMIYNDDIIEPPNFINESNITQEKLNNLRKNQKQREKKKVLNEKIEQDTSGNSNQTRENKIMIIKENYAAKQVFSSNNIRVPLLKSDFNSQLSVGGFTQQNSRFVNSITGVNEEKGQSSRQHISTFNPKRQSRVTIKEAPQKQLEDHQTTILALRTLAKTHQNAISQLAYIRSEILLYIEQLEQLLYKADIHHLEQRKKQMKNMRFYDQQIDLKEESIKEMLGLIAEKEMNKNWVQDELEQHTLKTIEVINISDIRIERDNLEMHLTELKKKEAELHKLENELEREKDKLEEKKRKRLGRK